MMRCTPRAAVEEGIVPGGGAALVKANLENLSGENEDQNVGINIVRRAIQAPARQIADNAGADGPSLLASCLKARRIPKAYARPVSLKPDQGRCHRPDQGCPLACRTLLRLRSADHHRSHGG